MPSETIEAADFGTSVDTDTNWGEVFDTLATPSQECIRHRFDGDSLESVLDRSVMSGSDNAEEWEDMLIFSCLALEPARTVFLSSVLARMGEDVVVEMDIEACLYGWVAGLDVGTMTALVVDNGEATAGLSACAPELFLSGMLEEAGMTLTLEDLSEEEATCLREWATDTDWTTLATGATGNPSAANLLIALLDCSPDALLRHPGGWRWNDAIEQATPVEIGAATPGELEYEDSDLFAFEATEGGLYDLDVTLEDYILDIYEADGTLLTSREYGSYTAPVIWRASATGTYYVRVTNLDTGAYTLTITIPDIEDDHPNSADNATPVELGVATQGELEYEGDTDFFAFEAEEGELYELELTHGTLQDSLVDIYDADGIWQDGNDDPLAPRLTWHAASTGTYSVRVASFFDSVGTYTLTLSDITDDHPNSIDNATLIEIGVATQGELEYEGASDFFAFGATEGETYYLNLTFGTLQYSALNVYDADGTWLAGYPDYGDSAFRLTWQAPSTGTYFVNVASYVYATGTYTLTITLSDIVDDHPNWATRATPIEVGVATQGELEYEGDVDSFTFEATEGDTHYLDVTLGTLQSFGLGIFGANGNWLDGNDNYYDPTTTRLIWQALSTGTYYVNVNNSADFGFGTTGTYTLTISPA